MTNRFFVLVLLITTSLYTTIASAEKYNVKPGMWETTYKVEMLGMPPELASMMQQEAKVERGCLEDAEIDFTPTDLVKECNVKTTRHSANKISWDIQCTNAGVVTSGRGEVNFNGDKAAGWFEMNAPSGTMGAVKVRTVFSGKRIGTCSDN